MALQATPAVGRRHRARARVSSAAGRLMRAGPSNARRRGAIARLWKARVAAFCIGWRSTALQSQAGCSRAEGRAKRRDAPGASGCRLTGTLLQASPRVMQAVCMFDRAREAVQTVPPYCQEAPASLEGPLGAHER